METLEGLKERRAWLLRQVDLTNRAIEKMLHKAAVPPRPTPQDLPGVPPAPPKAPRAPNEHQVNHEEFERSRRDRFEQLGVEYVPDEPNTAAFVVVTMKRLRDACRDDDELFALIDLFMRDRWAASLKPPFPLKALGGPKVFGRLLDEVRATSAAGAH